MEGTWTMFEQRPPVVSVMTEPLETRAKVRDEKGDRLLPHPIRRQNRLTARNKHPHRDHENKQENSKDKSEIPCRFKFCKNPSFGFWHSPVCLNYKSEKAKPNKKSKKGGAKGSVAILKGSKQLGCVPQDSYPTKSILRLQRHLAPSQNSGKKMSIARYYPKVCAS